VLKTALAFALCLLVAAAQSVLRSVWDGVYTEAQARRGAAVYGQECGSCHGTALTGGESAPPLVGGDFLSNWNGLTVGDLFDRIRTTMPANRPGTLPRDQIADVLAFMLSMNQFPAGKSELERQAEALKQIRLDASPPEK
jgi:mono/diheme cytochrome c family protein